MKVQSSQNHEIVEMQWTLKPKKTIKMSRLFNGHCVFVISWSLEMWYYKDHYDVSSMIVWMSKQIDRPRVYNI